ncbi:anti-anti-sigma factor [Pseudonocardia hierapolitana]|uniref:Anti-sigma factor antagonist n=1 Tax=Pseudonocardia hierapolitana TaxID=1128676 RepID=A0A561T5P0_9PSEU|nr:STAS domain-containing protein [Pseudonocardia hierapolitana]TWF82427.1 anti-anti-sigma factor [Pseudonocardia hierapolitana]
MVTITPVRTGPVSVLTVSGEIDLVSGPLLRTALDEVIDAPDSSALTGVVLDLTAVTFLGSAGLAVLVDAHEHATQRGIALKIVIDGPGSPVARAFQAAAIHEHLDVHSSVGDALLGGEGRPAS